MTYETEMIKAVFREKLRKLNQKKERKLKQHPPMDCIPNETNLKEEYSCQIKRVKDYLILTVLNTFRLKKSKPKEGISLKLLKIAQNNAYQNNLLKLKRSISVKHRDKEEHQLIRFSPSSHSSLIAQSAKKSDHTQIKQHPPLTQTPYQKMRSEAIKIGQIRSIHQSFNQNRSCEVSQLSMNTALKKDHSQKMISPNTLWHFNELNTKYKKQKKAIQLVNKIGFELITKRIEDNSSKMPKVNNQSPLKVTLKNNALTSSLNNSKGFCDYDSIKAISNSKFRVIRFKYTSKQGKGDPDMEYRIAHNCS